MKRSIRLRDIYSDDLYTRSRASEIRLRINADDEEVVLDFDQIGFMSRSFADELNNIMDDFSNVKFHFANCNNDIETMITKVAESRKRERKRGVGNAKMYEFKDMESLSKFFQNM